MAILNFQKPDKVIMIDSTESHGKFEFRPLEPGYGLTIGNALRRVLLSSLEGYAFTSVKIDGVDHEFSTIEGVVEDVTEIILNIKQIRLKRQIEDVENEKINVTANELLSLRRYFYSVQFCMHFIPSERIVIDIYYAYHHIRVDSQLLLSPS